MSKSDQLNADKQKYVFIIMQLAVELPDWCWDDFHVYSSSAVVIVYVTRPAELFAVMMDLATT